MGHTTYGSYLGFVIWIHIFFKNAYNSVKTSGEVDLGPKFSLPLSVFGQVTYSGR